MQTESHSDGLTRFSAIFERKGDLIESIVAQMKATCKVLRVYLTSTAAQDRLI